MNSFPYAFPAAHYDAAWSYFEIMLQHARNLCEISITQQMIKAL